MQFWQRFTLVTLGALALHGAVLWALQTLQLRSDLADKVPALLTRMLELPQLAAVTPAPAFPCFHPHRRPPSQLPRPYPPRRCQPQRSRRAWYPSPPRRH